MKTEGGKGSRGDEAAHSGVQINARRILDDFPGRDETREPPGVSDS